jgi:hypothetical protein
MISGKARAHRVAGIRTHVGVATSLREAHATKQSILSFESQMDCFASLAKMVWTAPDGIIVPDW